MNTFIWPVVVILLIGFFFFSSFTAVAGDIPCAVRYERYGVVCVCNSTYCDEISKIEKQPPGTFVIYTSSQKGLRFRKNVGSTNKMKFRQVEESSSPWYTNILGFLNLRMQAEDVILSFNKSKMYQTIYGFGGAFTDSAALNYHKLSPQTRKKIISSYFSENGIEYNMARVTIAGCDFSDHLYAYNELPENDVTLSHFNLTKEDYLLKIPFIKDARKAAQTKIHLIGTAWSPPSWMKTNKLMTGLGRLLPEYYQTWADYHLKFLQGYDKEGISFWGITTGNEPVNGIVPITGFNSMGWYPQDQGTWIANHLGPTIKNSFSNLKILAVDDQRFNIPVWIELMASNRKSMQYIDGIGVHWYSNGVFPPLFADITHGAYPDKFIIATEACVGVRDPNGENVKLGSWDRAEQYIKDIMEDLNHWYVGWLDWNMVLDERGGPNWWGNYADASMLAFFEKDEFVKQPYYYIIGHFSKFIPRGSIRIDAEQSAGSAMENVAFLRPDGGVAVVFYNRLTYSRKVLLGEKHKGHISITVPPQSIQTVLFW